jgi:uncharacterized protein YbjT (DUF2867 family)
VGLGGHSRTLVRPGTLPRVLLLTGATGTIGMPLLRRLTVAGTPVRCLVRNPRRLGSERVRVQIALGDLADPRTFRHALRGVETVVHLAAPIRDQPGGSIEELAAGASWQLVRAAERAGVQRFVFFSATGASAHSPSRLMRAKAIGERALAESSLSHTVFAASWVYALGDPFLSLTERMAWLPAIPIPGSGRAAFEPMWAEDVADCLIAALPGGPRAADADGARYELAGPQTLTYAEIVRTALRAAHRPRPLLPLPVALVRSGLRLVERVMGPAAFATWDEAELLGITMLSERGSADAERLGVRPRAMASVLGAGDA